MSGKQRTKSSPPSLEDWFFSYWSSVLAWISAGGTPEVRHIVALLRKGDPVPPEAQLYLADLLTRKKLAQRPKRPQFEIEAEQRRKALAFLREIEAIKRDNKCSQAEAFRILGKTRKVAPTSIKRRYLAATKIISLFLADFAATNKRAAQLSGLTEEQMLEQTRKAFAPFERSDG